MTIVFLGRVLDIPSTSYANAGGQGDRTASITVTSNIVWDGGTNSNLVDGASANNTTDSMNTPGVGAGVINDGDYIEFDFGSNVYIDELTITQDVVPNNGLWQWLGSNSSGTGFTAYGSATWNNLPQVVSATGIPAEGHRYWRWRKSGAGTWTNAWLREFTFKIAPGAV